MRIKRIELEGSTGSLTIERAPGSSPGSTPGIAPGSATIRIDSVIRDPKPGEQTWKTWHVESCIEDDALFQVAWEVQIRCDGVRGTASDINAYFRELQRLQD